MVLISFATGCLGGLFNNKPIIAVFITRDDNYENPEFVKIKNTDVKISAIVSGVMFELNDKIITVTADLVSGETAIP